MYGLGDADPLPGAGQETEEATAGNPEGIAARIRAALSPGAADDDDEVSDKEGMERFRARDKTLASAMDENRRAHRSAKGVYEAISFDLMYGDGICEVEEGLISQTLSLEDVSYQTDRAIASIEQLHDRAEKEGE